MLSTVLWYFTQGRTAALAALIHSLLYSYDISSLREAAMPKRSREDQELDGPSAKRLRPSNTDRLSHLSDELLLRTLSYLSVSDLVLCQM